jgi:hypothetical protein
VEYTEKLTEDEIRYICERIGGEPFKKLYEAVPKGFQRIYKGAMAKKLSREDAVRLAFEHWKESFLDKFIDNRIQEWMQQIDDYSKAKVAEKQDEERAILMTLPESMFSDRPDIYFKLVGIDCSAQMLRFIQAGCKFYTDYKEALRLEQEHEIHVNEQDNAWKVEKNRYVQNIEKLSDELSEKTNELDEIYKIAAGQDESIRALTDKITKYEAMIQEYKPLRKYDESEPIEYRYRSLCKVYINSVGRKTLRRITDIVDDKIMDEYAADFPREHTKIYLDVQSQAEDTVAVWDWDWQPNIKDPEKLYFMTKRNYTDVPIEIIVLEACHDIKGVIEHLVAGLQHESFFQKQLWCYRMGNHSLEGILCSVDDYESRNNGFVKLKDRIYQAPVFSIEENMIYKTKDDQYIARRFYLGIPMRKETVHDPMEMIRSIVLKRFNWSGMKLAGFSRSEYQNINQFIEKLPIKDICQEAEELLQCGDEKSKDLVERFVDTAGEYLNAEDIETDAMKRIIIAYPELMNSCKQEITARWEAENTERITKAKSELEEVERLQRNRLSENDQLEQQYENREKELKTVMVEIEQQRKLAIDVELTVRQKIEKARENAAAFIAEQAFNTAPPVISSVDRGNGAFYHDGQCLPDENLEKNQSIEDLIDTLRYELVNKGVAERYALPLAGYMYAAYLNKMPLILAGPCAREIAHAFSAALFGRTAGHMVCLGDYAEAVWHQAATSNDSVILIDNMFNPVWNQILFQTYSKLDKYFLAVTPYSEELMIEPKGLLNYFTPLFTELLVDHMPSQNYMGGRYNPDLEMQLPLKDTRHSELLKNISLTGFARKRINQVLDVTQQVLGNSSLENKDMEFLFCIWPLLMLQKKVDDIGTKIDDLEAENKLSKQVAADIRAYFGGSDE